MRCSSGRATSSSKGRSRTSGGGAARTLFTPALDLGILAGVTRTTLLEEAGGLGYDVREGAFPLDDLAGAEEAFTSSSVREVMPVVELDGAPLAGGKPGPAAAEMHSALRATSTN